MIFQTGFVCSSVDEAYGNACLLNQLALFCSTASLRLRTSAVVDYQSMISFLCSISVPLLNDYHIDALMQRGNINCK